MKNIVKLMGTLLLAAASNLAFAQTGGYIFATAGMPSYSGASSQPDVALRFGGGANFIELMNKQMTIGAEGAYVDFGSAGYYSGFLASSAKATGIMAAGVVTWNIPNIPLSVIGKVGMLHAKTDWSGWYGGYSGTTNGMFIGAGVRYVISKQIDVFAMYEDFGNAVSVPYGATTGLSMVSGGVHFRF